jgi:hypothetical protein
MEARKRRILEEADQVDRDMREFERIVAEYGFLVVISPDSYTPPDPPQTDKTLAARAREECEALIRFNGHPMQISELYRELTERGYEFSSREPSNVLTGYLLKNPRLKYYPKLGWWLTSVSWPPKPEEIGEILNPTTPANSETKGHGRRTPEKERAYQELRKLLEGRTEPTSFKEMYDHLERLGVPLPGKDPRQNLSAFITSIHEFRPHGPTGRGGWTFVPDESWSVTEGFKTGDKGAPSWRHNPLKVELFEATREILRGRTDRMKFQDLYAQIEKRGIDFGDVKNHDNYLANLLGAVPCFQRSNKDASGVGGWRYIAELDPTITITLKGRARTTLWDDDESAADDQPES